MAHLLDINWTTVKRILRYLKGTLSYGLHISDLLMLLNLFLSQRCVMLTRPIILIIANMSMLRLYIWVLILYHGGLTRKGLLLVLVLRLSVVA